MYTGIQVAFIVVALLVAMLVSVGLPLATVVVLGHSGRRADRREATVSVLQHRRIDRLAG